MEVQTGEITCLKLEAWVGVLNPTVCESLERGSLHPATLLFSKGSSQTSLINLTNDIPPPHSLYYHGFHDPNFLDPPCISLLFLRGFFAVSPHPIQLNTYISQNLSSAS